MILALIDLYWSIWIRFIIKKIWLTDEIENLEIEKNIKIKYGSY